MSESASSPEEKHIEPAAPAITSSTTTNTKHLKPSYALEELDQFKPTPKCPYHNLKSSSQASKLCSQITQADQSANSNPDYSSLNSEIDSLTFIFLQPDPEKKITAANQLTSKLASQIIANPALSSDPAFTALITLLVTEINNQIQNYSFLAQIQNNPLPKWALEYAQIPDSKSEDYASIIASLHEAILLINDAINVNIKSHAFALLADYKQTHFPELLESIKSLDVTVHDDFTRTVDTAIYPEVVELYTASLAEFTAHIEQNGTPAQKALLASYAATLNFKHLVTINDRSKDTPAQNLSRGFSTSVAYILSFINLAHSVAKTLSRINIKSTYKNLVPPISSELKSQLRELTKTNLEEFLNNKHFRAQLMQLADLPQNIFVSLFNKLQAPHKGKFNPKNFIHQGQLNTLIIKPQTITDLTKELADNPLNSNRPNLTCPGKQLIKDLNQSLIDICLEHLEKSYSSETIIY